ncbi:MAG: hypothetical protein FWH57_13520, partial [Oscillospiraceae bacterium]|nr:hypothetical protein [Oscillospiraceae bacterium]
MKSILKSGTMNSTKIKILLRVALVIALALAPVVAYLPCALAEGTAAAEPAIANVVDSAAAAAYVVAGA